MLVIVVAVVVSCSDIRREPGRVVSEELSLEPYESINQILFMCTIIMRV